MLKKYCKKCDTNLEININNFYFIKHRKCWGHICKTCQRIDWVKKRELRKLKVIELGFNSIHDYRVKNHYGYVQYMRSRNFNPKSKEWYSKRNKIDIDNLNDRYIKELIVKSKGIDVKNITPELIEIYRLQVKLKREIKNARET